MDRADVRRRVAWRCLALCFGLLVVGVALHGGRGFARPWGPRGAVAQVPRQVTLGWTAGVVGPGDYIPTHFQLQRCTYTGKTPCTPTGDLPGALVPAAILQYTDTTVTSGRRYAYTAKAVIRGVAQVLGPPLPVAFAADSEAPGNAKSLAVDFDHGTFWHTEYGTADPPHPHWIIVDLMESLEIVGFKYWPRADGTPNGTIALYELYVSLDQTTWGVPVAQGTLAGETPGTLHTFPRKQGRYLRLVALSEVNGNPWTSVAEFEVYREYESGRSAASNVAAYPRIRRTERQQRGGGR